MASLRHDAMTAESANKEAFLIPRAGRRPYVATPVLSFGLSPHLPRRPRLHRELVCALPGCAFTANWHIPAAALSSSRMTIPWSKRNSRPVRRPFSGAASNSRASCSKSRVSASATLALKKRPDGESRKSAKGGFSPVIFPGNVPTWYVPENACGSIGVGPRGLRKSAEPL